MEDDQNQNNINSSALGDSNNELETCKKQAEEYLNNWKRERADFINYKKDEIKRMSEFVKFGNESLILELIDVLDDLYLTAKETKNVGLDQVVKKFEDLLGKYEVEKIKVDGENFDPLRHEAVIMEGDPATSPDGDNGAGKMEEVRAGYIMHGRVIRPARVKIVK